MNTKKESRPRKKKKVNAMSYIETKERAEQIFEEHVSDSHKRYPGQYSLQVEQVKTGWLCILWYQRSTWVEPTKEKKVLLCGGRIFEDHKVIAEY